MSFIIKKSTILSIVSLSTSFIYADQSIESSRQPGCEDSKFPKQIHSRPIKSEFQNEGPGSQYLKVLQVSCNIKPGFKTSGLI